MTRILSSEAVGPGHPDKLCDNVSDAVLDAVLKQDSHARVACETFVKDNNLILAGEITTTANVDYEKVARDTVKLIGYTNLDYGMDGETFVFQNMLGQQSPDISQGVSEGEGLHDNQGAGDQGIMWGYATNEHESFMPLGAHLAHALVKKLDELRVSGILPWLRPDNKSQVSVLYSNGKPIGITSVIVAQQHDDNVDYKTIRKEIIDKVVNPVCGNYMIDGLMPTIHINGTGKFVIGGPQGDCGLTGRKIIVDTYGGIGRHGGGCFAGKDSSKVDRSAAYAARWVAKNLVAAGVADIAEVQLGYCIGVAEPTSLHIELKNLKVDISMNDLKRIIREIAPLTPKGIVNHFGLKNPSGWSYRETSGYGHFGRNQFPWEKLDLVDEIKKRL